MELKLGGIPASALLAEYGSPLYVYDRNQLEERMEQFKAAFASPDFDCHVAYASKAFCCVAMMQLVKRCGLWADVVSGAELYTTLKAGMDPAHLIFHGNNKTPAELELAFENQVGTIVCDHLDEAENLARFAGKYPHERMQVLVRVNPGVEAHTHKFITTASPDSKFGIPMEQMDVVEKIVHTVTEAGLAFGGFHAHIGSQIFDKSAFGAEAEKLGDFVKAFQDRTGIPVSVLDFGGGFAARYTKADAPIPIPEACETLLAAAAKAKEKHGLSFSTLIIEPGRSIAAEAGTMLYTVGAVKNTPARTFVFVDGGMSDNIRPALYQAEYAMDIANRMEEEKRTICTVAGKCCESGDILAEQIPLQPAAPGDILAVYTTGAYGWSMASNYNKLPVPAVVFVQDGQSKLAVKRDTYASLLRNEESL